MTFIFPFLSCKMSWSICPHTAVPQHVVVQFVCQRGGAEEQSGAGTYMYVFLETIYAQLSPFFWGWMILESRDEAWPQVSLRCLGPLCLCLRAVQPAVRCHQLVQWRVVGGSRLQRGREAPRSQAARWLSVAPLQQCPCGICLLETKVISLLETRGHRSLSAGRERIFALCCMSAVWGMAAGWAVREGLKVCLNLDAGGSKCSRTSLPAPFSLCVWCGK